MTSQARPSPTVNIVVTTIFDPVWLPGYLENISAHGHKEQVTVRIICDRKTPRTVYEAADTARRGGFMIDCPALDEQERYIERLGLPNDFIPWNSDNRRNVGFLRAWESGADVLISIDDDNYCRFDSDFVGTHSLVGSRCKKLPGVTQMAVGKPWFNPCSLLELDREDVYPRGQPYYARLGEQNAPITDLSDELVDLPVAINAGLWLIDPDVDAITRLAVNPRVVAARPESVVTGLGTWSPINTQNTALVHAALPAYYYVRMGYPLEGMHIDRFGDILSGYLLQKCTEQLHHLVRFGSPVADHKRTPHNVFKDLYHELAGIVLLEEFVPWLRELKVSGEDYSTVYAELSEAMAVQAAKFSGFVWDTGGREFIIETSECMRVWLTAIGVLIGSQP